MLKLEFGLFVLIGALNALSLLGGLLLA